MQRLNSSYKTSPIKATLLLKANSKLETLLTWFAFFMSFDNLIFFGINFSFLFFFFIFIYSLSFSNVLVIKEKVQFFSVLFGLGAIISVVDTNANGTEALQRALQVLPNFIYWSLLVIVLTNIFFKSVRIDDKVLYTISGKIFIGVLLSVFFYEFKSYLSAPFLIKDTPNSYAFGIVCFTAISAVYAYRRYGKVKMLLFLSIVLFSMLFLERRAGFVLVFISSFIAMNFSSFSSRSIVSMLFSILIVALMLRFDAVEEAIRSASPRIHESIYESKNITTLDQSYLTRVAMIEKGISIFKENPFTGIGLNNFANHTVSILGGFSGAELILHKELNNKSGHNSYISMLSEGGLFLLIPFLCLIVFNLYHFVAHFKHRTILENAYYWSFLAMIIHIYLISEMYNVFAWFLLAMVSSISLKYARSKSKLRDRKFVFR